MGNFREKNSLLRVRALHTSDQRCRRMVTDSSSPALDEGPEGVLCKWDEQNGRRQRQRQRRLPAQQGTGRRCCPGAAVVVLPPSPLLLLVLLLLLTAWWAPTPVLSLRHQFEIDHCLAIRGHKTIPTLEECYLIPSYAENYYYTSLREKFDEVMSVNNCSIAFGRYTTKGNEAWAGRKGDVEVAMVPPPEAVTRRWGTVHREHYNASHPITFRTNRRLCFSKDFLAFKRGRVLNSKGCDQLVRYCQLPLSPRYSPPRALTATLSLPRQVRPHGPPVQDRQTARSHVAPCAHPVRTLPPPLALPRAPVCP